MLSGVITGLVAFIAVRVITGLGEGAFYSNDRSLIAQETPHEKRSLGMGVVITGLAFGITIATVFAPNLIDLGGERVRRRRGLADAVPAPRRARRWSSASRCAAYFRRQEPGLPVRCGRRCTCSASPPSASPR